MSERPPTLMWTAEEAATLAAAQGAYAYKIARTHAERGVDPNIAAQHGVTASNAAYLYWMFVGPQTIFFTLICWYPLPLFIWKIGLAVMAWMLFKRMRRFIWGDPRIKLRYRLRTGWLTLVFALWAFLGTLYFIGLMMAATTP